MQYLLKFWQKPTCSLGINGIGYPFFLQHWLLWWGRNSSCAWKAKKSKVIEWVMKLIRFHGTQCSLLIALTSQEEHVRNTEYDCECCEWAGKGPQQHSLWMFHIGNFLNEYFMYRNVSRRAAEWRLASCCCSVTYSAAANEDANFRLTKFDNVLLKAFSLVGCLLVEVELAFSLCGTLAPLRAVTDSAWS